MGRLPDTIVGTAQADSISWNILQSLVDSAPRMAGHDGERAAMETLADQFQMLGLRDGQIDEFEIPVWSRGSSVLSLPDRQYNSEHELIGLPGTPSGTVSGPLTHVGHGTPAEFDEQSIEGAVVVAAGGTPDSYDRWLHRREKYQMAVDRGAIGFCYQSRMDGCLPPTGDIGGNDPPGAIPSVGISRELGQRLSRHAKDDTETELSVECDLETGSSGNVSARLGPETDQRLLVTAHHDAHDIAEGATDNGTGCALVAELARLLKLVEDDLDTEVQLMTFGAEEIGLRGSTYAARQGDDVKAVLNLDGIGTSRDLAVDTHGFTALTDAFDTVAQRCEIPIQISEVVNTHSDHWSFAREGVPAAMAYSTGGSDRRGWGHTHGDTLDKLDRRDLRDLAVVLAEAVLELADRECTPDHVDGETVRERAREEGYEV